MQQPDKMGAHARDKLVVERLLVQEHVGILELLVEPVLHLLHALRDALEITIPRKHDDRSVRAPVLNRRSIIMPDVFTWSNAF